MPTINGDNNDNDLQDTSGDDILNGMGGNDILRISLGLDEANGGSGGDSLVVDWSAAINAVLTLSGPTAGVNGLSGSYSDGSGTRSLTYTGIERFEITTGSGADVIVTGGGHDVIHTGAGDDSITAGGGNDTLIGGTGADTMTGGTGNDTFYIDSLDDDVVESANEGRDVAYTAVSYVLAAGVSLEVLSANSILSLHFLDLTGNELANELVGNLGDNVLTGGGGNDVLVGSNGNDTLDGGDGNDVLRGGADRDDMTGGIGDDTYFVDESDDAITEASGEGQDRVYASVSYALAAGVSAELLSTTSILGTDAIDLSGNEFAQEIAGNEGDNVLEGGDGADVIHGYGGNDRLYGDDGADVLFGGRGDDVYFMYGSADEIREIEGEGRDVVYVNFSYTLPPGQLSPTQFIIEPLSIEVLSTDDLARTDAIDLTGNQLANEIYGNAGVNVLRGGRGDDALIGLDGNDQLFGEDGLDTLHGGAGADTMDGGSRSDTYFVDNAGDVVIETDTGGGDRDVVYTSVTYALAADAYVEVLSAVSIASTGALNLTGNNRANELIGNNGANVLDGGTGADALTGFGGADTFAFTTALGGDNIDRILDFLSGTDLISLENGVFTGLSAGALPTGAFRAGAAAVDADDRIIYDSSGRLFFDVDGVGGAAQVQFAVLAPGTALAASDFVVI